MQALEINSLPQVSTDQIRQVIEDSKSHPHLYYTSSKSFIMKLAHLIKRTQTIWVSGNRLLGTNRTRKYTWSEALSEAHAVARKFRQNGFTYNLLQGGVVCGGRFCVVVDYVECQILGIYKSQYEASQALDKAFPANLERTPRKAYNWNQGGVTDAEWVEYFNTNNPN